MLLHLLPLPLLLQRQLLLVVLGLLLLQCLLLPLLSVKRSWDRFL